MEAQKVKQKTSTSIWILTALCLGFIVVNLGGFEIAESVVAQQCTCPQMIVGGNTSLTWPPGATVKVFFDDNVAPDRRAIYEQALNNWSQGNNQGVTFTTDVATGMALYTMYIKDAIPNGNNTQRGQVVWQYWDANGVLQGVDIQMNPNVTDPTALLNAMSHEISHNFGLNHTADGSMSNCTSSSLYNTSIGLNDTTNGAAGPTPCDRTVINSIYQSGGVHHVASGGGDGGGDLGGSGSGDSGGSCTEYWWVEYSCTQELGRLRRLDNWRTPTHRVIAKRNHAVLLPEYSCVEVGRWYAGCW